MAFYSYSLWWLTPAEAGAIGRSCQFHGLLALQPQGVEHQQQTNWQVWTLLFSVPRLSKLHRITTREERGTQYPKSRIFQVNHQAAVLAGGRLQHLKEVVPLKHLDTKNLQVYILFPGVYTPCDYLSSCIHQLKIPRIKRRALIVAISTLDKPLGCGIQITIAPCLYFLLCVPFKIFEKLI